MKKLLLCGLSLAIAFNASAQTLKLARPAKGVAVHQTNDQAKKSTINKKDNNIDSQAPLNVQVGPTVVAAAAANAAVNRTMGALSETVIGTTDYDLQSNRSINTRIVNNGDGTISAVYTGSQAGMNSSWPDRGTFYNYFDGTAWGNQPTARVEGATRCGFTNINVVNGVEYTAAHTGSTGMIVSSRVKGTGTWVSQASIGFPLVAGGSDVWCRMAVGGANNQTIHLIVNTQGSGTAPILGQNGPITYTRSLDGGLTWDINHLVIAQIDSSNYPGWGGDEYHIDAQGDNVAIALSTAFGDVVLMKSIDNGTTWTKTVVQQSLLVKYDPFASGTISDFNFDGIADTIESGTGDVTVSLDANGIAHVAWVNMLYLDEDTATDGGYSYFPNVDGIVYWNEGMSVPVINASAPDMNGDGIVSIVDQNTNCNTTGYYGGSGLSAHPSIGFDASGNVYMTYSTICELADTTIYTQSHRHVFAVKSTDNGNSWSDALDLVPLTAQGGDGEYQEAVWGSLAKLVDGKIHVVYQRDDAPGYSLLSTSTSTALQCQAANNLNRNDIIYVDAPVTDITTSVKEITSPTASFSIQQNYPNPFNGTTRFEINLVKSSEVTIEVYSVIGKMVKTFTMNDVAAGQSTITIDGSDLAAGMYTYTVKVGTEQLTNTMVIK